MKSGELFKQVPSTLESLRFAFAGKSDVWSSLLKNDSLIMIETQKEIEPPWLLHFGT